MGSSLSMVKYIEPYTKSHYWIIHSSLSFWTLMLFLCPFYFCVSVFGYRYGLSTLFVSNAFKCFSEWLFCQVIGRAVHDGFTTILAQVNIILLFPVVITCTDSCCLIKLDWHNVFFRVGCLTKWFSTGSTEVLCILFFLLVIRFTFF